MKTIWKFPLRVEDSQEVKMPDGAQIIHADSQNGYLCIWAIVDTTRPETYRTILVRGTGHPLDFLGRHIDSVQMGCFVWHVFEKHTVEGFPA